MQDKTSNECKTIITLYVYFIHNLSYFVYIYIIYSSVSLCYFVLFCFLDFCFVFCFLLFCFFFFFYCILITVVSLCFSSPYFVYYIYHISCVTLSMSVNIFINWTLYLMEKAYIGHVCCQNPLYVFAYNKIYLLQCVLLVLKFLTLTTATVKLRWNSNKIS